MIFLKISRKVRKSIIERFPYLTRTPNDGDIDHGAHFLFENRALVDFQEKNEQFIDRGAHFLFENRSLVDFQIGNEPCIVHGAHFLFENRPMSDFQIGSEQYRSWRSRAL